MGYTASSFTAGQQPTTAQWNVLWANDASFNDGTGIGTNAIAAASLAANAISLGYAQITTNFATSSTTFVQVTGLTATVTIPAGGRKVRISVYSRDTFGSGTTPISTQLSIWDGTVGSGTELQEFSVSQNTTTGLAMPVYLAAIVTPAAGSKTYNVGMKTLTSGGTSTIEAASTYPAYILVETI